jgi:Cu/Ag efflux pump CusA
MLHPSGRFRCSASPIVRIAFTYDYTYEEAEQKVINQLTQVPTLPNGAVPGISPDSPIGEIYRYRIVGPRDIRSPISKRFRTGF